MKDVLRENFVIAVQTAAIVMDITKDHRIAHTAVIHAMTVPIEDLRFGFDNYFEGNDKDENEALLALVTEFIDFQYREHQIKNFKEGIPFWMRTFLRSLE